MSRKDDHRSREVGSPKVTVTRSMSMQRKGILVEGGNAMMYFVSKGKGKEKPRITDSNINKKKKNLMHRVGSGTQEKIVNTKRKEKILQDRDTVICKDFRMMKLNQDSDGDGDYCSVDSRLSSWVPLGLFEKRISKNVHKVQTLENCSDEEIGRILEAKEDINIGRNLNLDLAEGESHGLQPVSEPKGHWPNNKEQIKLMSNLESKDSTIPNRVIENSGINSESQRSVKLTSKSAWELNDKYHLTADFPPEVWNDKKDTKLSNTITLSPDLMSSNFPRLTAATKWRRGSFPITSNSSAQSNVTTELPTLSGRFCKVQLPSKFPGVSSPPSENESESLKDEIVSARRIMDSTKISKKNEEKKRWDPGSPERQVPRIAPLPARASPDSSKSRSPLLSSKNLAMHTASNEYLAARVVTQLNSAFEETFLGSENQVTNRANCVTPNLMPRRHSAMVIRSNTGNLFEGPADPLFLPSVDNECCKSLPNLTGRDKTKRVFVAFDKDCPSVKVVDLKGRGDIADKCRILNNKLTKDDLKVEAMLKEKAHKKAMVEKWVIASATQDT